VKFLLHGSADYAHEVLAVPYPFMGRFSHEAVAIDLVSWRLSMKPKTPILAACIAFSRISQANFWRAGICRSSLLRTDLATIHATISKWAGHRPSSGWIFLPDGQSLFVNIQGDTRIGEAGNLGYSFAIWGSWEAGAL
jgi:hypothetical protein